MKPAWQYVAVALAAAASALLWPLTAALSSQDAIQPRLVSAAIAGMACLVLSRMRGKRSRLWIGTAVLSAVTGVALLLAHFSAADACVAEYDGRPVIIGRDHVDADYIRNNPGLSGADLLLDAGGDPRRVWTSASIRTCRLLVSWVPLGAIPFFAISAAVLVAVGRYGISTAPRSAIAAQTNGPANTPVYDAFISYRHLEPDNTYALEILELLEKRKLRVAIDYRDFSPNEHFLSEMERCVKQSRFVLCIVTTNYLESDHTSEEAIISKTLDLAERRRRIVPLIFERTELPVWLHGLVGIDFTASAMVDSGERLAQLFARHPAASK